MPNLSLPPASLAAWYRQELGQELAKLEEKELSQQLSKLHGYHLLQLGSSELPCGLKASPIIHKITANQEITLRTSTSEVQANYSSLPFASEQFEAVILPHILELELDPTALLEETWRVLAPEGYLIVLGFNPWSFWGIKHLMMYSSHMIPWHAHFHSAQEIKHSIKKLKGEIINLKYFFYRPPAENSNLLKNLTWLEQIMPWLLPALGGVYLLVAQKHVLAMTPMKAQWNLQTALEEEKEFVPTTEGLPRG